jgi:L-lactate dehydrogenase
MARIGIIGAGQVGSSAAYAMALQGAASEIVLCDRTPALAAAQAEDIAHAIPFAAPCSVTSGPISALAGADIVVLSAGVAQRPGESRIDLLSRNAEVFDTILGELKGVAPDAILLIASNPVDVMTDIAVRLSGKPAGRVIGSGTILDTARFRSLLGRHLHISPGSVHAYVLGEHGDSEVLAWSSARVGSVSIRGFAAQVGAPVTDEVMAQIDDGVRRAAYRIIEGKGATWFGIGAGLSRIARAILRDERAVLSVSIPTPEVCGVRGATLSLPRIVGRNGVEADLMPDLDPGEAVALAASARLLADLAAEVRL